MIVNWEKYSKKPLNETSSIKSKKSIKAYQDPSSQLLGLPCEYSFHEGLDYEREDSITSPTSILYPIDTKNQMNLTEANISEIYPQDNNNNNPKELSILSQIDELSFSRFNINNNTNTIDYSTGSFGNTIRDLKAFMSFIKRFNTNPNEFYQTYRDYIMAYSNIMIFNSYSHVLLIQVFPYFNQNDKEYFYSKIVKDSLNAIIKDEYAVEVLINYIFWILNDENDSILIDILNYIKSNFIQVILNLTGKKFITTLINQKNNIIMNMFNDLIINNTLTLCITTNGLEVIKYFIQCTPWGNQMLHLILTHFNILSVHPSGYLIIQYLINLNINQISSIIINYMTSNFIHYSNDEYGYMIIENIIIKCNKSMLLPLINTLYSTGMINQFLLTEKGRRVLMMMSELLPFMTKEYLLSQFN